MDKAAAGTDNDTEQSAGSPRIAGRQPAFFALSANEMGRATPSAPADQTGTEDVPWIKVKSQHNADGSDSHVWEKWVAFSVEPLYLALFAKWDPGMLIRRHGHYSPHTLVVLDGSMTCGAEMPDGGRECPAGTHITLPFGASFGPFLAGPEGTMLYEVMMGDPRSWSDEPEAMERALAAHGVTPLPDPPIELPGGLEDLRAVFSRGKSDST